MTQLPKSTLKEMKLDRDKFVSPGIDESWINSKKSIGATCLVVMGGDVVMSLNPGTEY